MVKCMSWKTRPTGMDTIENLPTTEWLLFLDESGTPEMKTIHRLACRDEQIEINDKYFTLTGALIKTSEYQKIIKQFDKLKRKYWNDGIYHYRNIKKNRDEQRQICFHSYEIRKRKGPFHEEVLEEYNSFIQDLDLLLSNLYIKVFSVVIDKGLCYDISIEIDAHRIYNVGASLLLENIGKIIGSEEATVMAEARGKYEDKLLLDYIVNLVDYHEKVKDNENFKFIKGLYFNGKWNASKLKSCAGLEIADLFCYPITTFVKTKEKSRPFLVVESKIHGYPEYEYKGLIRFP